MVDWAVATGPADGGIVPIQLCGGAARGLQTDEPFFEPDAR